MQKKQTAVQWLQTEVKKRFGGETFTDVFSIEFTKALEMERQQIIDAAADHCYPTAQMALNDAERYYEQHYAQNLKP